MLPEIKVPSTFLTGKTLVQVKTIIMVEATTTIEVITATIVMAADPAVGALEVAITNILL